MTQESGDIVPNRTPVKRWAKIRLWAGYVYLLAAVVFAEPQFYFALIGIILVLMGIALRLISTATLVKDKELCVSGIYGATRNPLYLGSAMVGLGVASLTGSWWFPAGFTVVLAPIYMRMILIEEKYLLALFPETFPAYVESTPRFFPRIPALMHLRGTLDADKLRKSREISSAALILIVVILILALHRSWLPGN